MKRKSKRRDQTQDAMTKLLAFQTFLQRGGFSTRKSISPVKAHAYLQNTMVRELLPESDLYDYEAAIKVLL